MAKYHQGVIGHPTSLRKLAKPVALTICALFAISAISMLCINSVQGATMLPVHTAGDQILDSNNNVVTLRGVGMAGMTPDLIFWGNSGGDSWGDQWQAASSTAVTQTFQELSSVYHVNMIRVFVYPEWWWVNNVVPGTASGQGYSSTAVSTQSYVATLASEAEQYGIYIDIVPYQLTCYSGSFSSDTYITSNMAGSQGLPLMNNWDSAAKNFLSSTGLSESAFWTQYWQSMANTLKAYPNVIFEAWNEPGGSPANTIPSGYLSYLTTMYNAIRGTGSTNLIMMQWQAGWQPNCGMTLGWASQINTALGGNPTNMIYTTHFYYFSPSDDSPYWNSNGASSRSGGTPMSTAQIETQLQNLQSTMGINAPIVINEEGSCLSSSNNAQNDYTWFNNLLQAQTATGFGIGAYYWLSNSGLGGTYDGEYLLSSGYTAASMGQALINSYTGTDPTPAPTQNPTPTPTATAKPTASPTPTAKPTASPTPTAKPTASPTPTPTPTPTTKTGSPTGLNPTPTPTKDPTPTPTAKATATPTPKPTLKPTATPTQPTYMIRHYWGQHFALMSSAPLLFDFRLFHFL